MTIKYQRPSGAYTGQSALTNRDKYQTDAAAQPKISISSSKMDGDFNYLVDALNDIDDASGSQTSIAERLNMSLNTDGSLKASASTVMDDWINHNVINLTRVDNSTLTCDGDQTAFYIQNRRVRLIDNGVPLFASLASAIYSAGTTTLTLVDIVDGNAMVAVLSPNLTSIAYSPIMPGAIGNAIARFTNVSMEELNLKKDNAVLILTDTAINGKIYGLRSVAGNFEIVENTGTESSPNWLVRTTIDVNGINIANNAITTAKLAANAVTSAKLTTSGVTAGTYTLSTVTVDDKGRLTAASSGTPSAPSNATTTVKGIVELATNTEVKTGTDTTRAVTPSSLPLKAFYESPEQVLTTGGLVTLTHGLGGKPLLMQEVLICKIAQGGYAVGDDVVVGLAGANGGVQRCASVTPTITTIGIRYSSGAPLWQIPNKSNGANVDITNSYWRYKIRAWR